MDTLAKKISLQTLKTIVGHFALEEIAGEEGGPYQPLVASAFGGAPAGEFRLWRGSGGLSKVVYTGITVEPIGLDSHMIFAFTEADSLVPTFTLDSVYMNMPPNADPNFPQGGDMYAFHLDLVPKCDLGINEAYMRHCYEPLTEARAAVLSGDGVFAAQLSPLQHAIMSPWMLAQRTTAAAYEALVFAAAQFYTSHWLRLVDAGVDADIQGMAGEERDALNRALIFNRDIDPVWSKIDGMLGSDLSDRMLAVLRNPGVESSPAGSGG